jgi:DNA polymerase-3 subunit epsilon
VVRKRIIFDTETTGFRPGSICQLSYIVLEDLTILQAKNYYFKVDYVEPGAERVHGLSVARLKALSGNRVFEDHYTEIAEDFETADTIIAHNIDFDMSFMRAEFNRCDYYYAPSTQFCTMKHFTNVCRLVGNYQGQYKWPKLEEVMNHYNIRNETLISMTNQLFGTTGANYHDARTDVVATYLCLKKGAESGHVRIDQL